VACRSGGGGGGARSSGGSGRRDASGGGLEGNPGANVRGQPRLIVFDEQDVIAPRFDHSLGEVASAEHRVPDRHRALQRQDAREFRGGLVFVGLGIGANPGEDRLGGRGVGGDEGVARPFAVAAAAGRLAVGGDSPGGLGIDPAAGPPGQGGSELLRVEPPQGAGEGRLGGRLAAAKAAGVGQRHAVLTPEASNAGEAGAAHEHGQGDHPQYGGQWVDAPVPTARVGQRGEGFNERAGRHSHRGRLGHGRPPQYPTPPTSPRSNEEWPCTDL
jgi:hypothetical protein